MIIKFLVYVDKFFYDNPYIYIYYEIIGLLECLRKYLLLLKIMIEKK